MPSILVLIMRRDLNNLSTGLPIRPHGGGQWSRRATVKQQPAFAPQSELRAELWRGLAEAVDQRRLPTAEAGQQSCHLLTTHGLLPTFSQSTPSFDNWTSFQRRSYTAINE